MLTINELNNSELYKRIFDKVEFVIPQFNRRKYGMGKSEGNFDTGAGIAEGSGFAAMLEKNIMLERNTRWTSWSWKTGWGYGYGNSNGSGNNKSYNYGKGEGGGSGRGNGTGNSKGHSEN